jgi:hypothetical protein
VIAANRAFDEAKVAAEARNQAAIAAAMRLTMPEQKADIRAAKGHVRFTPESGHVGAS